LPEEYEKCMVGLNAITRDAWNTEDKDCYRKRNV